MRVRRVVGAASGPQTAFWDAPRGRWIALLDALAHPAAQGRNPAATEVLAQGSRDTVAFLATAEQGRAAALELAEWLRDEEPAVLDSGPRLPFAARSLRAFLLSPTHSEQVARGMAGRYAPDAAETAVAYERANGQTFPRFQPSSGMWTTPLFYQGNHNALVPDGTHIDCPPYGSDLDFELELGFVVCRDLCDPTRGEARAAIGGFVILNDVSLRDTQWEEIHSSALGPVVKCKSFATAMSSEVVTADEFLDDLASVTGQVLVDGERWATGRADDFVHPPEACVERAAAGESVLAGDLFSTGTFAGCSGIELGRLPRPGARVTLDVDRIGTLTNQLGEAP